ncbi:MAG: TonB-dependent receptor [Candidatus Nitrotoga sp.]|nr:TonB-dependent receptor [Candidatus Nitrotoga sp.]MDO9447907.1 TonB-dependent receptor [Candidatus Nitrotoga sp.]MDP1636869.1 TonB-dependent receptor [Candidatus Nitrotoga sp.]MDP1856178.1 TonB-dependent receptor [Candidatus Nitrotoga sp.]MDP3498203.1 TonB-dependent receptor [Candidatus Nitrotoga sp.]
MNGKINKPQGHARPITKTKLALAVAIALNFPIRALAESVDLPRINSNVPDAQKLTSQSSAEAGSDTHKEFELPRIDVVGTNEKEEIKKLPGAVTVIKKKQLELMQPLSTQDALKTVPGVVIREEEGMGFIPNIGMRGLDPNRSQKLLVLEDGVPVAPGLFLANESYYSPRIERMEGIEVLKGAAGLRYGPTTIGGVINYKTKAPEDGMKVTTKAGSHGFYQLGVDAGGRSKSGDAFGGVSAMTSGGDGYRHNGFKMNDIVAKGGMAIGDNQWVAAKFSHYDNEINTSYVGLRPNEYKSDPTKNPAPNDWFLTDRNAFDVNHELEINRDMKLKTVVYWSQLNRDFWRRDVQSRSADGTAFVPCDGKANCMTGRNRAFEMAGVDSRLHVNYDGFGVKNEGEIGLRLHRDYLSNKTIASKTNPNARSGELIGDDTQKAEGIAFYGQNRFIFTDKIAATLGLRVETYDQSRKDERTGAYGKTSNTEVMPGVGMTWQFAPEVQLFAGAYEGFSPALVAQAISASGSDEKLDAERSRNFEIGVRGSVNRFTYEATAFHMDFQNQIIPQSQSGGVGATVTNAGETLHQGLEGAVGFNINSNWSVNANATYLPTAKFNSKKIVSGIDRNGNRLLYAPELVSNLALNYQSGGFRTGLAAYYISEQFVDPENTVAQSSDGRRGVIPAYTTFNLNAHYVLNKHWNMFGTIRNLFDRQYIASRNPDGIFPGIERNFQAGVSYKF